MSLYRFPTNYIFFEVRLHPQGEQNSLAALFPAGWDRGGGQGCPQGAPGRLPQGAIARTQSSWQIA